MTTTETGTCDARAAAEQDAPVVASVSERGAYRRILRRETHSSRSGATIVVLIALVIVSGWVGVEAVFAGLGRRAILFSPLDVLSSTLHAATTVGGLVIAVGIVTGVVGAILIVLGLKAGRRGRHTIDDDRVAVVVDDQVVAAALARRARTAAGLAPGQVNAWVARSSARITITPATGTTADEEAVLAAARADLDAAAYRPAITPQVRVNRTGRLGA